MKVDSTRATGTSATRKSSKGGRTSGTAFSKMLQSAGQEETVQAPTSVASVDALLAVQGVDADGRGQGNQQAQRRAEEMLERLDDIRVGLLTGSIPQSQLEDLAHNARRAREEFIDPRLAEALDEIELRAKVELAKLGVDI